MWSHGWDSSCLAAHTQSWEFNVYLATLFRLPLLSMGRRSILFCLLSLHILGRNDSLLLRASLSVVDNYTASLILSSILRVYACLFFPASGYVSLFPFNDGFSSSCLWQQSFISVYRACQTYFSVIYLVKWGLVNMKVFSLGQTVVNWAKTWGSFQLPTTWNFRFKSKISFSRRARRSTWETTGLSISLQCLVK